MGRRIDRITPPPPRRVAPEGGAESDETKRLVRDLMAISTLPAVWMGAEPQRIAESLLAALDATVRPAVCYFRLAGGGDGLEPDAIELAHLDQRPAGPEVAAALRERLVEWAVGHDPGELMPLSDPRFGARALRVWVHPLGHDPRRGVLAAGFTSEAGPGDAERALLNVSATQAIVAYTNVSLQSQARAAGEEARALYEVSGALAAELDLEAVVQRATDAARALTGAKFAAFFYNDTNERGELYTLYTLSGAPREAFSGFGMPRNTPIFEPTFRGTHAVRIADVTRDPRYGTMAPHHGMPKGHPPVRSYLAVPVTSRSGEVLGGLFFGHPEPGVFGERAERIAIGIATQAAIAIDNARLFAKAEDEIRERERTQAALQESEARYRRLADLLPVAVYTCEAPGGTITYFNARAVEAWGQAPRRGDVGARFCGSHRLFLPDGSALEHDACPMATALREGRSFRNEEVIIERPDGSRITALVNIDPQRDPTGRVVGAINVFHDVTALKQAERALRDQNENLETLLETLPVGVFIAQDPECRRIVGNRASHEMLRLPRGANLSKSAPSGERPEHFRVTRDGRTLSAEEMPVQRAARGEVVEGMEVVHEFDDGSVMHALVSARPLFDPVGRPRGAVAAILDITQSKAAEHALREADRRKDEFLATLAHELRNPLAPVRTSIELLDRAQDDPGVLALVRDTMQRQVDQLVHLVDDLLDVSRITRDRLELRRSRVELASIVEHAVETCRPIADAEGHRVTVQLPDAPVYLDADPVRMTQVICNILHNACKYTQGPSTVRLRAEWEGDDVIISVQDDGIGIPPEQLDAIFEMFAQVDGALERSRGGLGIGLTLVKRLVAMHGGTVSARSAGAGRGSTIAVQLPTLRDSTEERVPPAATREPATDRHRILVVDDNEDAAEMLTMLLQRGGHQTDVAHDGERALELAEQLRPDLVLLDIGLPKLSGLEVCRRIRDHAWGAEMVVVALTGWGQEEDRGKSRDAGFDDHLTKPVSRATLDALLRSVVRRADA